MVYTAYLNDGSNEDLYPEVGHKYWVVVRRENFELVFEGVLDRIVDRHHMQEPEDQTPSFHFANGASLHGEGIAFYKEAPAGSRNLCSLVQDPAAEKVSAPCPTTTKAKGKAASVAASK